MVTGYRQSGGPPARVAVVGAGLAGLAAACELADRGFDVSLVERRPFAGGKTYSFRDRASGAVLDNGQHVFLGCCTAYIGFLRRLGTLEKTSLQPCLHVEVIDPERGRARLAASRLPGALSLLPALLTYRHLSPADRARVLYGALWMRALGAAGRRALDGESFHSWLRRHGQSDRAVDLFWNLITVPTLNGDARSVSAELALMVFQEGFLASPSAAAVGVPRVPLDELHVRPALDYLAARGGRLRLGGGVRSLLLDGQRARGVALADGSILEAEFVVSAVPPAALLSLLPEALRREPFFARLAGLGAWPIVNLHFWYERPVTGNEFAAFLNSPVQWVFNRTRLLGLSECDGQHLVVSLSVAGRYLAMKRRDLLETFRPEMERLFPAARRVGLRRFLATKEPEATFAAAPGCARLRPPARTPVDGLVLAGAWTDTGWPATMEGAVRSGLTAAREVAVQAARRSEPAPTGPDGPPSGGVRLGVALATP
jgi:squalene-associated FAD-dependent desaturase